MKTRNNEMSTTLNIYFFFICYIGHTDILEHFLNSLFDKYVKVVQKVFYDKM